MFVPKCAKDERPMGCGQQFALGPMVGSRQPWDRKRGEDICEVSSCMVISPFLSKRLSATGLAFFSVSQQFTYLYIQGFEFDTGIHYVGEMAGNSVTKFLVDQLTDGQLQWAPLDPIYDEVVLGSSPQDAKKFHIGTGKENFKNALLEKFPEEEKAIDNYLDLLQVLDILHVENKIKMEYVKII